MAADRDRREVRMMKARDRHGRRKADMKQGFYFPPTSYRRTGSSVMNYILQIVAIARIRDCLGRLLFPKRSTHERAGAQASPF